MNGFERYGKKTRRAQFLEEMEQVVPWKQLCGLVEPHYPKPGRGRQPVGVEPMLRIYFLQQWFNLSDPAVEEALYDSPVMRDFVGIDLGRQPVPDETTVCKFRHLLEAHDLCRPMLELVNQYLGERGVRISTGTIVDATIIAAPSSTKNREQKRDPEMKQTQKRNQWYFGMKAHVGVDSESKLIHSFAASSANVADAHLLPQLLHGREQKVWGDSGYRGKTEVIRQCSPAAEDLISRRWRFKTYSDFAVRAENRIKSKTRSRVEHVFHTLKRVFGYNKVRYRGLKKNSAWLLSACALINLYTARHRLLATTVC